MPGGSVLPSAGSSLTGHGSALVRLLHEGTCKLEEIGSYSEEELRHLLRQCGIPFGTEDSKVSGGGFRADRDLGSRLVVCFLSKEMSICNKCLLWYTRCLAGSQGDLGDHLQPGHDRYARPFPPISSSGQGNGSRLWGQEYWFSRCLGMTLDKLSFISASFSWFTKWK